MVSLTFRVLSLCIESPGRLQFRFPDQEFLNAAIEAGALAGRAVASEADGYKPCITASARRYRRFVRENLESLFSEDDGEVVVRRSASAARGL